ncbi:MAG: tetratricopeptide repeat protein, partial [Nitrospirae bacterium]|nr:tetratricopeptide repeat protein [Nitrospirota bacterium]
SKTQEKQSYDKGHETRRSSAEMAKMKFDEGMNLYRAGQLDNALQAFGQAVYLDESKSRYHYSYGLLLKVFKKFKEAEQALLNAVKKSPENSDYVAELGHLYLDLGMKLRARRNFEKALSLTPDNKKALEGLATLGEEGQ